MSTKKISNSQAIHPIKDFEQDTEINQINEAPSESYARNKKRSFIISIALLVLLIIFFARIPYIGSYPDAYIFEILFGNSKYLIYLLLVSLLLLRILDIKFRKVFYTKRFIVGYIFLIISCILIFTFIQYYWAAPDDLTIKKYIEYFTQWANDKDSQMYKHFLPVLWKETGAGISWIDSGIIGTIIVTFWKYVAGAIIVLIILLLLLTSILIFTNKTNAKFIVRIRRKIGALFAGSYGENNAYNELKVNSGDALPTIHKEVEIQNAATIDKKLTPPISFLTNTSVDHYFDNKSRNQKIKSSISKFLSDLNIEHTFVETIIMPQFTEIVFGINNKKNHQIILDSKDELLSKLKIETLNILFKGDIVRFEILNSKISKISLTQILKPSKQNNHLEMAIGMGYENTPITFDINKNHSALIVGKRGSGATMLLMSMIASLTYVNTPQNLQILLLSLAGDKSLKSLENLPHLQQPLVSGNIECIEKLTGLLSEIKRREELFHQEKVKTLFDFNKHQIDDMHKLPTIVLIASGLDKLLKSNIQATEIFSKIMDDGVNVGVFVICLTTTLTDEIINPKIYDKLQAKFVLQLENEQDSMKIFNSMRGLQLYGNGDGFYFNSFNKTRTRFQTCYLNINELIEIVKIIKTFYSVR